MTGTVAIGTVLLVLDVAGLFFLGGLVWLRVQRARGRLVSCTSCGRMSLRDTSSGTRNFRDVAGESRKGSASGPGLFAYRHSRCGYLHRSLTWWPLRRYCGPLCSFSGRHGRR